jgi:hypothetical protein
VKIDKVTGPIPVLPRGLRFPELPKKSTAGCSFMTAKGVARSCLAIFASCLLGLLAGQQPASACAGPHCDPNWAFQIQINAQRAQEQHVLEAHRRQMDIYYSGQSSSSDSAGPISLPEPPRYSPPPPPRGWQSRYTGFVTFKVGEDEDRDSSRFRYDYAVAMNYNSAADAKAAAAKLCRERVLRSWESYDIDYKCEQDSYVYTDAFLSLVTYWNGSFGIYEQPTKELALSQHGRGVEIGNRIYYCADLSSPSPDNCQAWLSGIGLNGLHRSPGNTNDYRLFACPSGAPDPLYKIVGVDRLSGSDVPLCGPDPVAFALKDREERWDAYAVHPRYVLPFAAGGFSDLAAAQRAVLDMCNSFTGGGCAASGHHKNGVSVFVRNEEGRLFLGVGRDEASALADGRAKCSAGQILPCPKVISRLAGDLRVYGPRYKPGDFRYYGAVAAPGGKIGSDRKAWVAHNFDTQADADQVALQACQRAKSSNEPCRVVGRGLGTRFFGYTGFDGSRGVFTLLVRGGNSLIDLENREAAMLNAICQTRRTQCRTIGALDASDEGEGHAPNVATLTWPHS